MMVEKNNKNQNKLNLKTFEKDIDSLDQLEAVDLIESLKRKMKKCAQNFQFEEAALLRDQIIKLNGYINK